MDYGMTFAVDMRSLDDGTEHRVLTSPGDYIRAMQWVDKNLGDEGTVRSIRENYALVWFSLQRRGELAEWGLPEELTVDAIDAFADRFTAYVTAAEDGDFPLARKRGK